ncbi:MAG: hypothetical protein DMF63_06570 [Acidobacteria bacterium]|nr:MAG: hypothetical protein DMF63_06570 [Acidobacteriota bacterium]
MEETNNMGSEEVKIQSLLDAFLGSRGPLKSSAAETSFHLDEDSLTAFAEGNLAERESVQVVDHLVQCGFCRHKTVELVRLSMEFEGVDRETNPLAASEPRKISEVLSGLLAKIFGPTSSDQVVFAHEEKKIEEDAATDEKKENDQ